MSHEIALKDALILNKTEPHTFIDVRSPNEFKESSIPGSINIPLFTNEERAEIGTLYKKQGSEIAKQRGLEIVSTKLPQLINSFRDIQTSMTVFCWRGGMRSKTVVTVLQLMGIHANRLEGGYRSYRKWVIRYLEKEMLLPELYVLNGYTGTGKTTILHALHSEGIPVIDLEGMAGHRGSIFGQIGKEPSNQKTFDSLLVQAMNQYKEEKYVFTEGESRRIGKVLLPEEFFRKKEASVQLFIEIPLEERVKNILQEYQPWKIPETFLRAFSFISKRIHQPVAKQIKLALQEETYEEAVKLLLLHYYDPRYEHSNRHLSNSKEIIIQADTTNQAIDKVLAFTKSLNL